jgi:hypothetical protein
MSNVELVPLLFRSLAYHRNLQGRKEEQPIDGSKLSLSAVDELATLQGPLIDKLFTLYACGVHDYQSEVFPPRQILAMIFNVNIPYAPSRLVERANGNGDLSICFVGPKDKKVLLQELCSSVENFSTASFSSGAPSPEKPSRLVGVREELMSRGVDKKVLSSMSDKALSVYFLANEAQFLFALIHPFWDRNGRTSEEFMHLICATNGVGKLLFCKDPNQRNNPVTEERMELLNGFFRELLVPVAQRMELDFKDGEITCINDLYRVWFRSKGKEDQFEISSRRHKKTLGRYLQHKTFFSGEPELMEEYFAALRDLVRERIEKLGNDELPMFNDNITQTLVAHQLSAGITTVTI